MQRERKAYKFQNRFLKLRTEILIREKIIFDSLGFQLQTIDLKEYMKNQRELFFLLYHWALDIWNWKGNKRSEREATEIDIDGYLTLLTPVYSPGQVLQVGEHDGHFRRVWGTLEQNHLCHAFKIGDNKCYRTPWHLAWGRNNRVERALQYLCAQRSMESCQEVERAKLRYISGLVIKVKQTPQWMGDKKGSIEIQRTSACVDEDVLMTNDQISIVLDVLTFLYSLGLNHGYSIRYRSH